MSIINCEFCHFYSIATVREMIRDNVWKRSCPKKHVFVIESEAKDCDEFIASLLFFCRRGIFWQYTEVCIHSQVLSKQKVIQERCKGCSQGMDMLSTMRGRKVGIPGFIGRQPITQIEETIHITPNPTRKPIL